MAKKESFYDWVIKRGGHINPCLNLFNVFPNGSRGIAATTDIPEAELLILMPMKACIHTLPEETQEVITRYPSTLLQTSPLYVRPLQVDSLMLLRRADPLNSMSLCRKINVPHSSENSLRTCRSLLVHSCEQPWCLCTICHRYRLKQCFCRLAWLTPLKWAHASRVSERMVAASVCEFDTHRWMLCRAALRQKRHIWRLFLIHMTVRCLGMTVR